MMLDGSSREVCQVGRIRTNTPLQALVTLNDPVFLEAAQHLARKMKDTEGPAGEQISSGYYAALLRDLTDAKRSVLLDLYEKNRLRFEGDSTASAKLIKQEKEDPELAALTVVANAILNLDEFVMKE